MMMTSIFASQDQSVINVCASTGREGMVKWKLRTRGSQNATVLDLPLIAAFDGPGVQIGIEDAPSGNNFSYFRGKFALEPEFCRGILRFELETMVEGAPGMMVILELGSDPSYAETIVYRDAQVQGDAGRQRAALVVDFSALSPVHQTLYGYIQACLPTAPGAVVSIGHFIVDQSQKDPGFRKLNIRFDPFGDVTKASSRLRAWKLIELLKVQGHDVSIGQGEKDIDVYVAQKNRPFNTANAVKSHNPNAIVVYDFDDNYTLAEEGVLNELIAFLNVADVVTCGSSFLAETARHWHRNVYVMENPVDVEAEGVMRKPTGELRRVGWFGSPEGLTELAKLRLKRPVETLTKGGDIEFNLATVDQDLTGFDLLLFPVEATPWNLAKNANRMIKALALGVPVLVSDTPEQRRIHALCELPEGLLIDSLEGWDQRIEDIAGDFPRIEAAIANAAAIVWRTYSTRAVLGALFDHLAATTKLDSIGRRRRLASPAFAETAALFVDSSQDDLVGRSMLASSLEWAGFASVNVCTAKRVENELMTFSSRALKVSYGDFLSLYRRADAIIDNCESDNLLIMPPGIAAGQGLIEALEAFAAQDEAQLCLFSYSEYYSAAVRGLASAYPLTELLMSPTAPLGPLAVKTRWLRAQAIRWERMLDLWPWAVAVKAMATTTPVAVEQRPFAFQSVPRLPPSPSHNYAEWLKLNQPATAKDLPGIENQSRRILIDIVSDVASWTRHDLPKVVAHLQAENLELRHRVGELRREVKASKPKK